MPVTSPHSLYYPDAATVISPLHPILANMQASTETALTAMDTAVSTATSNVATLTTQLAAQGVPWFATTGARDTAIPTPTSGKMAVTGTGTSMVTWTYNGSAWVDVHVTSRGGITFNLPGFTYSASVFAPTGYASAPLNSWGNTSWRTSTSDNTACYVTAGLYRVTAQFAFSRSGDSDAFTAVAVTRNTGGYYKAEVIGLAQPNARMLGRINGAGMDATVTSSLYAASVTTTSVSCRFTVERVGD